MAKRVKREEHENLERWLVSYADFITLLFAFFVVMYSISSINEGKYRVLSDSLVAAFRSPTKTLEPIQVGKPMKSPLNTKLNMRSKPLALQLPEIPLPWVKPTQTKEGGTEPYAERGDVVDHIVAEMVKKGNLDLSPAAQAALKKELHALAGSGPAAGRPAPPDVSADQIVVMKKIAGDVEKAMQPLIDRQLIAVRKNDLWVEIEIKASVLFASGSAAVNHGAVPVLDALARILKPFPNVIRVEGFTDDVPIKNAVYPSNWELSAARAASVVRLLAHHGIAAPRLRAVGYGQYHAIADNATAEGRQKNRRVVLVVLANNGAAESVRADLRKIPEGTAAATVPAAPVVGSAPAVAAQTPAAAAPPAVPPGAQKAITQSPPATAPGAAPRPGAATPDARAAAVPAPLAARHGSAATAKPGISASARPDTQTVLDNGPAGHEEVRKPVRPAPGTPPPVPAPAEAAPAIAPPIHLPAPIHLPQLAPLSLPFTGTAAPRPPGAP